MLNVGLAIGMVLRFAAGAKRNGNLIKNAISVQSVVIGLTLPYFLRIELY